MYLFYRALRDKSLQVSGKQSAKTWPSPMGRHENKDAAVPASSPPAGEEGPGSRVEDSRQPETPRGAPRQNDGLEGIEQHGEQADNAGGHGHNPHRSSFARSVLGIDPLRRLIGFYSKNALRVCTGRNIGFLLLD
jgi:hypothetical protein